MMTYLKLSLASLLVLGAVTTVHAQETCSPQFSEGWARLGPNKSMLAGYGHLVNDCKQTIRIASIRSAQFGHVDMHETTMQDGMSKMRPVKQLDVAAGQHTVLEPGGKHLMLMQPKTDLKQGDTITLHFTLADGRSFDSKITVKSAANGTPQKEDHSQHGHHQH